MFVNVLKKMPLHHDYLPQQQYNTNRNVNVNTLNTTENHTNLQQQHHQHHHHQLPSHSNPLQQHQQHHDFEYSNVHTNSNTHQPNIHHQQLQTSSSHEQQPIDDPRKHEHPTNINITSNPLPHFNQSSINTTAVTTSALALVSSDFNTTDITGISHPNMKLDDQSTFRIRQNYPQHDQHQQSRSFHNFMTNPLPVLLHPEHHSISKITLSVMRKLIPFCATPWVRDFLISETVQPSTLSHTTRIFAHQPLTCRFNVTVIDGPSFVGPLHQDPTPIKQIDRSFTFMPSWTAGSFIVGFGQERDLLTRPPSTRPVRFARNQKDTAFLLTRAGEAGPDHLVFHFSQHESSNSHIRSCVCFKRRALAAALRAPTESLPTALAEALMSIEHIREFRRCPVCSTHGVYSKCKCPAPVAISAADPRTAEGTTPRSGIFEGVTISAAFVLGRVLHSTSLATRMQLTVNEEHSLPTPPPITLRNHEERQENWIGEYTGQDTIEEEVVGQELIPELMQESNIAWGSGSSSSAPHSTTGGATGVNTMQTTNTWGNNGLGNDHRNMKMKLGDAERERVAQIRKVKAEMRRERNRASAHRSNMKKKAINDALKAELQSAHERVEELRAREVGLRQENMRLRRMLSGG